MFSFFTAIALLGSLAGAAETGPDEILKADRFAPDRLPSRFNLHAHLMTPNAQDLKVGVENSHRLARNAHKLGMATDDHRRLVADNPPAELVDRFDPNTPLPSKGFRLDVDNPVAPLPLMEGPGVAVGLPEATRDFWLGDGDPQRMWEVYACPVADVDGYVFNPNSCYYGQSSAVGILDFIRDTPSQLLEGLLDEKLVPFVVDFITRASSMSIAVELGEEICDTLQEIEKVTGVMSQIKQLPEIFKIREFFDMGINQGRDVSRKLVNLLNQFDYSALSRIVKQIDRDVGDVKSAVEFLVDNIPSIPGGGGGGISVDDVVDVINPFDRRLSKTTKQSLEQAGLGETAACTGNGAMCSFTGSASCEPFCTSFDDDGCEACGVCYQPSQDMSGLCMSSEDIAKLLASSDALVLQETQIRLLAGYLDQFVDNRITQTLQKTLGIGSEDSLAEILLESDLLLKDDMQAAVSDATASFERQLEELQKALGSKIDNKQCPIRNDSVQEKIQKHDKFEQAKRQAVENGIDESTFEDISKGILDDLLNQLESANLLDDSVAQKLAGSTSMAKVQRRVLDKVHTEKDEIVSDMAGRVLRKESSGAIWQQKPPGPFPCSGLDCPPFPTWPTLPLPTSTPPPPRATPLADMCHRGLEEVQENIEGYIRQTAEMVIGGFQDSVISPVEDIYTAAAQDNPFLNLVLSFLEAIDPLNEQGPLKAIYDVYVKIQRQFVKAFLFGANGGTLPSEGTVLSVGEARDGRLYLQTGCNSDFEAELLWYKPTQESLSLILEAIIDVMPSINPSIQAGLSPSLSADGGGAFFGTITGGLSLEPKLDFGLEVGFDILDIPVVLINTVWKQAVSTLGHMGDVCEYLDGYVQFAKMEATYENSRYILRELACQPADNLLQRGYGCDGKDNTCEGTTDECAEDVFPPELDVRRATEACTIRPTFQSEQDAMDCILSAAIATDDCKPVQLETSVVAGAGTCTPTVEIAAVAQGCGNRKQEDITRQTLPVQVDAVAPTVSCTLDDLSGLDPQQDGDFVNANFAYTVLDDCTSKPYVTLEIFSNEVESEPTVMIGQNGTNSIVFLKNDACKGSDCLIDGSPLLRARLYQIRVTAKDDAGNVGTSTCSTVVGRDVSSSNVTDFAGEPLVRLLERTM